MLKGNIKESREKSIIELKDPLFSSSPLILADNIGRRTLNTSITRNFLDATEEVLLSPKKVHSIFSIPPSFYPLLFLVCFQIKRSSEGFGNLKLFVYVIVTLCLGFI